MILHCDLKADNILIDNGRAKVSDFGLSTLFDPSSRATIMNREDREIHQDITAPEVKQFNRYSILSDVYSFGCCLFSMYWKGRHTFSLDTVQFLPNNHSVSKKKFFLLYLILILLSTEFNNYTSYPQV